MLRVTNAILIAGKIMGIGTFSWWWIIGITSVCAIYKILNDRAKLYRGTRIIKN